MNVSTNFKVVPKLRYLAMLFEDAGYEFYFVGGFVRDTLMQSTCWDVDATTNAQPETIKQLLREGLREDLTALYTVGEKYGTIGVKIGSVDVEITTYRTEQYLDGTRHPEVQFGSSLEEDLSRRDFTINAIACDKDANIVDPFGGVEDIQNGVIRFVGKPIERILEDPLRLLRAVRFASRYDFAMHPSTKDSVWGFADKIEEVSKERIRDELTKMLVHEQPSRAIRMLRSLRLLGYIMKEVDRLDTVEQISPYHYEDAFEHTMRVLDESLGLIEIRLAALLHDTGKWATVEYINHEEHGEMTTFHGHEQFSAKYAHRVLHRLRFPHVTVNRVTHLVACHMRPLQLYNELDAGHEPSRKAIRRFIKACHLNEIVQVEDVMELNRADMAGHAHPNMDNWRKLSGLVSDARKEDRFQPEEAESPLNGNELMELFDEKPGPGPWIGATKAHLTDLVICGIIEVDDKEGAKREALRFWNHTE
jgi:tRNA nucleotidyltransferase/poly(A) polymerase